MQGVEYWYRWAVERVRVMRGARVRAQRIKGPKISGYGAVDSIVEDLLHRQGHMQERTKEGETSALASREGKGLPRARAVRAVRAKVEGTSQITTKYM